MARHQQGRPRVGDDDRKAIQKRMKWWYKTWRNSPSQAKWAESLDIGRTTVVGWFRKTAPTLPDLAYLLVMARKQGMSLNWLLLGDLPEMRQTMGSVSDVGNALRSLLVTDVAANRKAWTREELDSFLPAPEQLIREVAKRYGKLYRQARAKTAVDRVRRVYADYLRRGGKPMKVGRNTKFLRDEGISSAALIEVLTDSIRTTGRGRKRVKKLRR